MTNSQDLAVQQATRRVDLYRSEVDQWKQDHEEAMACLSFEQTLQLGVSLYDFLISLDEEIRSRMLSGQMQQDAGLLKAVKALFGAWLLPCPRVEERLRKFERKGYTMKLASEFRSRCAEARWMMKPAGEAFDHQRVVDARDEAVDAIRSGEAKE